MRIALFGGRFDPVHNGHVAIANETLKDPTIDEVWLIPANTHPWRSIVASARDRLSMLYLVETPQIKASDIDIVRGGETFTIDTIRELHKTTDNQYIFIVGSDQINSFDKWRDSEELERQVPFLVFPRKGTVLTRELPPNFSWLTDKAFEPLDDSATEVRRAVKAGESIAGLVPKVVEEYIKKHHLYV